MRCGERPCLARAHSHTHSHTRAHTAQGRAVGAGPREPRAHSALAGATARLPRASVGAELDVGSTSQQQLLFPDIGPWIGWTPGVFTGTASERVPPRLALGTRVFRAWEQLLVSIPVNFTSGVQHVPEMILPLSSLPGVPFKPS